MIFSAQQEGDAEADTKQSFHLKTVQQDLDRILWESKRHHQTSLRCHQISNHNKAHWGSEWQHHTADSQINNEHRKQGTWEDNLSNRECIRSWERHSTKNRKEKRYEILRNEIKWSHSLEIVWEAGWV